MGFTVKKVNRNMEYITLPDGFNLELHLIQYPPAQCGFSSSLKFNKEKAYYFLELISSIAARNPDVVTEGGYTPICHNTVRNSIKDIKQYIDYLINTRVIICNGIYSSVSKKSFGYKWSSQFNARRFSARNIECRYVDFEKQNYSNQYRAYPYLFHWYQQNKLMIDNTTENYAFQLCQEKLNDLIKASWKINNKGVPIDPQIQYQSAIRNISMIKHNHYGAHLDSTSGRLYSAFTGLGKDYRRFVTYNGERLVGIDISNSQPYIASLILNREFWSSNSSLPLSLQNFDTSLRSYLMNPPDHPQIIQYFDSVAENDFTEYRNMVSSGGFYENIIEVVNGLGRIITRDEAKVLMFYTIYSSNKLPNEPILRQMREIFKQMFPKVADFFKEIKHEFRIFKDIDFFGMKQHNRLAILLQSIESKIILHRCCKRIWEEGNHQVPIFTIHDSIATTVEYQDYVKRIMEDELKKAIGIKPTLKLETWRISNLDGYPYPTLPATINH